MVKFKEDHKKDSRGDFIPEGVHKVKIMFAELGETNDGKEYIEFTVADDEDREGRARMWFTTDAAINYTFNIIRGIFVHNAPEGKKDEIRNKIDALEDSKQLEKACQMLIGKEAWYQNTQSDRTYTDAEGNQKHSYDRNIYGYEPSPKKVSNPEGVEDVDVGPIKTKDSDGNDIEIGEF